MTDLKDEIKKAAMPLINMNVIELEDRDLIQLTFMSSDKKKTEEFIQSILPKQENKND